MYQPSHFAAQESAQLAEVIGRFPFATVVTQNGQAPFATHIPLLFDAERGEHGTLRGHVARANPQWHHFESTAEVLVIFQGPHAYISPHWYLTHPAVPTWNYVAVHAYGPARLIADETELRRLVEDTTSFFEAGRPEPWKANLPADYWARMLRGIVGFEIPITRLEGKFKLSQNRSPADVSSVINGLEKSLDSTDRETAAWMKRFGQG